MEYSKERSDMVKYQIEHRGIDNPKILKVMREVPRHIFVPEGAEVEAYYDSPLPIGYG